MKHALALSALLVFSVTGCVSAPTSSLDGIEDAERARFAAWVKGDVAAIGPLLADDLRYCHSSGYCQNKTELLGSMSTGNIVYKSIDIVEMKPRAAAGAAIINGTVEIRVDDRGKPLAFRAIYTDVYVKENGRWLLSAWQSTLVPPPK